MKTRTCPTCNVPFKFSQEDELHPKSGGTFVLCKNVRCYELVPVSEKGETFGEKATAS